MDDEEGAVPTELVAEVSPFRVAMMGTCHAPVRCVALEGAVGGANACTIYARRPSTCRDFRASWEDGTHQPGCDQARAAHGLAPLSPGDFGGSS
jgi:Fe-S-cluster containining protein